jgi:hypothetical protein
MPLLAIDCPQCQHRGFVGADRLPGVLICAACDFARWVRDGGEPVRSALTDQLSRPRKPQLTARGKRILVPRQPAVV